MSYVITCRTLFDITFTGVLNRNKVPENQDPSTWLIKRNTQNNFDTILQAISLRSQPDVVKKPVQKSFKFDNCEYFGFLYQQVDDISHPFWEFDFTVQHQSVFNDGISEFGSLYNDCHNIPMIRCGTEWPHLGASLDCTSELRNIYFSIK